MNINIIKIPIIVIIVVVWTIMLMFGGFFLPNSPKPEITYNEFPLSLEYEIDGEYNKVSDALICEFDGFGFNEGNGKFRKWKAKFKSGNTRITLLKSDNIEIYYFSIKDNLRVSGVFMGDTEYYSGGTGESFPDAWYTTDYEDKTVSGYIISADEMWEKYRIKLINWSISSPIENSFK